MTIHLLAADNRGAVCGSAGNAEIVSAYPGNVTCAACLARRRPARDVIDLAWYRARRKQRGQDGGGSAA